jgi:hypothetical protein
MKKLIVAIALLVFVVSTVHAADIIRFTNHSTGEFYDHVWMAWIDPLEAGTEDTTGPVDFLSTDASLYAVMVHVIKGRAEGVNSRFAQPKDNITITVRDLNGILLDESNSGRLYFAPVPHTVTVANASNPTVKIRIVGGVIP